MYNFTVKMKISRWKVKGCITICTIERSAEKRGEGRWNPTYKLALLLLVETEKICSKGITRERLLNLKDVPMVLAWKLPWYLQTTKCVKAG